MPGAPPAVKPGPCRSLQNAAYSWLPRRVRTPSTPHDDCLRTRGTILRTLAEGLYEASLPNGKPVTCHLSKELAANPPELSDGTVVLLEISPFDLDRARIAQILEA
jgi:translation initiation factor IF-1